MPRRGTLHVKVLEAQGLKKGDLFSSDPFVKLKIEGLHRTRSSQVFHDTSNPKWNEDFVLKTTNPHSILNIQVLDSGRLFINNNLGFARLPVGKYLLNPGVTFNEWVPLRRRSLIFGSRKTKGNLHIIVNYVPSASEQRHMVHFP
jgi:Ca2+-dependent lipid-binding protein